MKNIFICIAFLLASSNGFTQNIEFNLSKGKDASNRKEYNLAVSYFNKVIQEDSNWLEAYVERAHANSMLGNYKKAIEDFNFVLKKDSNNTQCYFGIATIYDTWLNDKYGAIEYYTKVIDVSLKNGDNDYAGVGCFMRAELKKQLGDKSGYIDDLKRGAVLNNSTCKFVLELEQMIAK